MITSSTGARARQMGRTNSRRAPRRTAGITTAARILSLEVASRKRLRHLRKAPLLKVQHKVTAPRSRQPETSAKYTLPDRAIFVRTSEDDRVSSWCVVWHQRPVCRALEVKTFHKNTAENESRLGAAAGEFIYTRLVYKRMLTTPARMTRRNLLLEMATVQDVLSERRREYSRSSVLRGSCAITP